MIPTGERMLGHVAPDGSSASNERVLLRAAYSQRQRVLRSQFVTIVDAISPQTMFLGRIINGPFFPDACASSAGELTGAPPQGEMILAEMEIQGELKAGQLRETNDRPAHGSAVRELPAESVRTMLGLEGDMVLGHLTGREDLPVALQSRSKDVLPRNIGIFGTVGSGKSNSVQVLIEEAAAAGWAVILLDLEGEYIDMDQPASQGNVAERLAVFGRRPKGVEDFHVYHPVSCTSDRDDSRAFTLRVADFDTSVTAELIQASMGERNALMECIDYYQQKYYSSVRINDLERQNELLDPSPQAKLPFTIQLLRTRASERSPRTTESLDYVGLQSKLQQLLHSGAFDQTNLRGLDPVEMLVPGRVNVIDVSVANDTVKNLVTADLLRKAFAYKIANEQAPPSLLVIEEAHSFMSRERVQAMQATLQMLRNVTRRGRKRWLSLAFVSQQPGHLPAEIFELCNTRLVHTLRSMHNLDSLMATTGDVTRELWSRCPLLGTGEAILSTPQLHRSVVARIRPAASSRRFVR